MGRGVHLGDEVLVAREDDDDDQIAGKRDVDQRQGEQDRPLWPQLQHDREVLDQHLEEDDHQRRQGDRQPDVHRRHQPARHEQDGLERAFDGLFHTAKVEARINRAI